MPMSLLLSLCFNLQLFLDFENASPREEERYLFDLCEKIINQCTEVLADVKCYGKGTSFGPLFRSCIISFLTQLLQCSLALTGKRVSRSGATDEIRQSLQNPHDLALRDLTLSVVADFVSRIRCYFELSLRIEKVSRTFTLRGIARNETLRT